MNHSVMNKTPKTETVFAQSTGSDGKAIARVGLAEVASDNSEFVKGHGRAFTAGAGVQANPEYIGVGMEATWVEVGADFGNVGGVKVGVSADSELGAGSEGLAVKALGTGMKMDKSGTEVTVLGTGIKLGSWSNPYGWFSNNRK